MAKIPRQHSHMAPILHTMFAWAFEVTFMVQKGKDRAFHRRNIKCDTPRESLINTTPVRAMV